MKLFVCLCYGKSRNIFNVTDWEWNIFYPDFKWIPTQIQVFPQCLPSGNLCCNGKCFTYCSVSMPSSSACLPDPILFLCASIDYSAACVFFIFTGWDFFLSEAGEGACTRSAGCLQLSNSPLNVCCGYMRSVGPFGWTA